MVLLLHAGGSPWHWHVHPDFIALCVFLEAAYLYTITQLREEISDAGRVRRRQLWSFTAAVFVIWLGAGTPIHDLSEHYLLSAHMFQHFLFTMIAAPLLIAGTPVWMWQALLRQRGALPVSRLLTKPVVSFSLFNAVLVLTHLPVAMNLSLHHHWLHFYVHAVLIVAAMLMWWPILSEVPELPKLSAPLQIAYLFLQSLLPAVIASFVTFSDRPVYSFYANAPRIGLSAIADQQIAGGLMKLLGSLVLWSFIGVAFFRWYEREQAQDREPRWDEVEEELRALGLTTKR